MAERRDDLRAADADRTLVAERLRAALDEGRLDLGEYDERLQRTYAAKTYRELDTVLADLPGTVPAERSQLAHPTGEAAPAEPHRYPHWLIPIWGSWFTTSLICVVIWLATGMAGGFWPIWVIGPWGAVLLGRTLMSAAGDPGRYRDQAWRERADRRRARDERRRQRRGR